MTTALITGATKGIGLETARQLSKKGLHVYLGSRNIEKGEAVADQLRSAGFGNVQALELDVTNLDTIQAARNTVERERGKLDVLISNAGILGAISQHAIDTPVDDVRKIFETNVFGSINTTRAFLDLLRMSESPRLTLVTSGLASLTLQSDPTWQFYDVKQFGYIASKAALNAYAVVLAYELKDSPIKVNAVDPGFTKTDFNNNFGTGSVESAAAFIIKHTLTGDDGPTGKYFSNDIEDETEISPW
ncbi:SDR family NAD(P)-dependent oxidoreductase [Streptomyces sp. NPDC020951]|uniref:SDR family NAD(P)-dependent oxidoreductase n=1 Tax=Streptomyces sp. NPDC020951 TaxID=3365104 RepID=UPI00379C3D0A